MLFPVSYQLNLQLSLEYDIPSLAILVLEKD